MRWIFDFMARTPEIYKSSALLAVILTCAVLLVITAEPEEIRKRQRR